MVDEATHDLMEKHGSEPVESGRGARLCQREGCSAYSVGRWRLAVA